MSLENISVFVTIALVIVIIVFLFKKMVALALACGAILILFNVGFVMNGAEIREFFKLDDYLDQEQASMVENAFNDFDQKRDEYGVIDAEEVSDDLKDAMAKGTVIVIGGLKKVDIVKFSKALSDQLLSTGAENIDMEALEEAIRNNLEGIEEGDLDRIMEMIQENLDEAENKDESEDDQ